MCKYPNLDLVNMNACIKFGEDLSICSQDIERKQSSGINRLCVQSQPRPCQYQCIKFYQFVLKILSGNEIMTDGMTNGLMRDDMTDNPNPIYPSLFQS